MVRILGEVVIVAVTNELAVRIKAYSSRFRLVRAKLFAILNRFCCSDLDKLRNNSKNWSSLF